MPLKPDPAMRATQGFSRLLLVALIAGAFTGIVGGLFHRLLDTVYDSFLQELSFWHTPAAAATTLLPGWVLAMLIGGLCLGLARWLVRLVPDAAGSGIQQVEGVFHKVSRPAHLQLLPIKFIGGLLSMAPGAALGREGPTVQMAAVIGHACGRIARLGKSDRFLLYSAVAGSGLTVAFNAPLAGAAFVIEEVAKQITLRHLLATLVAVASATFSLWAVYGNQLTFSIATPPTPSLTAIAGMTLLGALCGVLGALYNQTLLYTLNRLDSCSAIAPELRAALVGMLVGLIAWFYPLASGGGEMQVQKILTGEFAPPIIGGLLALRWLTGPLCYASGVPGGLFAPLLLLGAALGSLSGNALHAWSPDLLPTDFALVGMAALFASIVQAPLTGVLLVTEMAGSTTLVVPLLLASATATMVTTWLHNEPIYDSLLKRMVVHNKPV